MVVPTSSSPTPSSSTSSASSSPLLSSSSASSSDETSLIPPSSDFEIPPLPFHASSSNHDEDVKRLADIVSEHKRPYVYNVRNRTTLTIDDMGPVLHKLLTLSKRYLWLEYDGGTYNVVLYVTGAAKKILWSLSLKPNEVILLSNGTLPHDLYDFGRELVFGHLCLEHCHFKMLTRMIIKQAYNGPVKKTDLMDKFKIEVVKRFDFKLCSITVHCITTEDYIRITDGADVKFMTPKQFDGFIKTLDRAGRTHTFKNVSEFIGVQNTTTIESMFVYSNGNGVFGYHGGVKKNNIIGAGDVLLSAIATCCPERIGDMTVFKIGVEYTADNKRHKKSFAGKEAIGMDLFSYVLKPHYKKDFNKSVKLWIERAIVSNAVTVESIEPAPMFDTNFSVELKQTPPQTCTNPRAPKRLRVLSVEDVNDCINGI